MDASSEQLLATGAFVECVEPPVGSGAVLPYCRISTAIQDSAFLSPGLPSL
jgi:hypothetical protein